MTELSFYGFRPPGIEGESLPGRLIVIEATDGAGRSTHVALLKEWLEDEGYAVLDTGLRRSDLAGPGIQRAKGGHTLDPITLNLFYAADFWDRLERQILPALRAGMVVLADRYVFSLIARAAVLRGSNVYESFVQYQRMLLAEFRRLAKRHGFTVIDARRTVSQIHQTLRSVVDGVVRGMEEWPTESADTEQLHVARTDRAAHAGRDGVDVTRSERAAPSG